MKKRLAVLLALCLWLALSVPAFAAETTGVVNYCQVKIVVDGAKIVPKDANGKNVEPFIYNGTTYLPVRSVANALGLGVAWENGTVLLTTGEARTATIGNPYVSTQEKSIAMGGSDVKVTLDGKTLELKDAAGRPVTPIVSEGVTYLPIRAIADALNVPVLWDGESATVYLGKAIEWKLAKTVADDGAGKKTLYTKTYDKAGRVLTENYTGTENGQTSSYQDTYTYDARGNLLKQTGISRAPGKPTYNITETYTYDANDRVLTHTYLGKTTGEEDIQYTEVYSYDANGVCRSMVNEGYGEYHAYSYDAAGNLVSDRVSYGEPAWEDVYTYDARGNVLTKITYGEPDRDVWGRTTYTYDDRGNQLSMVYESYDVYGNYDMGWEDHYTYDQWGNQSSSRHISYGEDRVVESDTGTATTRDMSGSYLESEYYENGQVTERYTYTYNYNDANQPVTGVCTYHSSGNRVNMIYQYDAYGNTIRSDYSYGGYTAFEYVAIEK